MDGQRYIQQTIAIIPQEWDYEYPLKHNSQTKPVNGRWKLLSALKIEKNQNLNSKEHGIDVHREETTREKEK